MNKTSIKPMILSIDDDVDIRHLIVQILRNSGFEAITAESGKKALQLVGALKPDSILLDILMPEMDGYETCAKLQENRETSNIPVIFLSALDGEQDKSKAFAVGGVDFLSKPIQKKSLLEKIEIHLKIKDRWKELDSSEISDTRSISPSDFLKFKKFLNDELKLTDTIEEKLTGIEFSYLYPLMNSVGIKGNQTAKLIAKYFGFRYLPVVDPESIQLGVLPIPFAKKNSVIAIGEKGMTNTYVLSNPFNWELLEILKKYSKSGKINFVITEPENIYNLLEYGYNSPEKKINPLEDKIKISSSISKNIDSSIEEEIEKRPVVHITNTILYTAVSERASDIHIEPKEGYTIVRFRIDGDMREMLSFNNTTGVMVITRLKALAGLDITERRKPQDGGLEATIDNRKFKLRLATTSTPNGESIIMRLLEPDVKQKSLQELGMTDKQVDIMMDFANRTQGLIFIVGPTGSGKTTTIYSLLSQVDCRRRSLISVEDPVEYRISFANQQQVNEKMGVTFEALLKSSVRQDPDILFIGEIRDQYSAKVAIDFSSTGHVTITTLHTSNATTAIFRLERLGIARGQMADTILGIVAQRLLKKLCPHCKKIVDISQEEIDMLSPYIDDLPAQVAHPAGCPRCNETGYFGREAITEIIHFDRDIRDMIRTNKSIAEIREFIKERGDYLISDHAVEKMKKFLFSPQDVYERVLIEETVKSVVIPEDNVVSETKTFQYKKEVFQKTESADALSILVVDDDEDTRKLLTRFLEDSGYKITLANDGIDALIQLSQNNYDLVISDIQMPNLDGFKFIEIKNQKGILTPVIFLTSQTSQEDEVKGLELGASDFIKKPVKKDLLLLRIRKILNTK